MANFEKITTHLVDSACTTIHMIANDVSSAVTFDLCFLVVNVCGRRLMVAIPTLKCSLNGGIIST